MGGDTVWIGIVNKHLRHELSEETNISALSTGHLVVRVHVSQACNEQSWAAAV
jgi:hypothetical protein